MSVLDIIGDYIKYIDDVSSIDFETYEISQIETQKEENISLYGVEYEL